MSPGIDEGEKQKFIVKLLILCRSLYLSYHISHASVITTMCYAIITSISTYKTFNVSVFSKTWMTVSNKSLKYWVFTFIRIQLPTDLISLSWKWRRKEFYFVRVLKISLKCWKNKKQEENCDTIKDIAQKKIWYDDGEKVLILLVIMFPSFAFYFQRNDADKMKQYSFRRFYRSK